MKKIISTAAALGILTMAGMARASVIDGWDMSLTSPSPTQQEIAISSGIPFAFDQFNYVEPGSLTDPDTGAVASDGFMPSGRVLYSTGRTDIFTDATMAAQNGAMTWKERDTQGPGLSVVTGDDVTGANCIMSAGWMPESPWGTDIKQCSDPWQSSNRFKMVGYVLDGPVDLTFNVTDNGQTDVYRVLQKYGNQTGSRVTGFSMELGFMVGGQFIKASPGDGIAWAAKSGQIYSDLAPTHSDIMNQGELGALMAHGLFGAPDKHHLTPGYFNPYVRANFGMLAGETSIVTTGMAQVHRDLFGEWLPSDQMKGGMFFDDDGNPYTDNILMANCTGAFDEEAALAGAANAGCDGMWVSYRQSYAVGVNSDGTYSIPAPVGTDLRPPIAVDAATISAWMTDPLWIPGDIDDLANVNINAFLSVGRTASWPTSDGAGNASFTIRITPTFDVEAAQAEPGLSDPAAFVVSINAPSSVI
ncbi:choice-of-anchor F family protein [Thiovibrio sp. JS02]